MTQNFDEIIEGTIIDAGTMGEALKEDKIVVTRYGNTFESLPMIAREAKQATDQVVEEIRLRGGYFKTYNTLAEANADIANIPVDATVKVRDALDGGDYYKASAGAATLTKSNYDPLTQFKLYSDAKVFIQKAYKKFAAIVECYVDENRFTRLKAIIDSSQSIFFDMRLEESAVDISDLKSKVDGQSFYKKIIGIASIYLDEDGSSRLKEETITAKFTSYISTEQKQLIAGAGISLLETEQSITIEASDIVYETPHEYVLCLIAGQSNASYYGGDAALAPQIPNNVCFIWDNAANTLREINDGSSASNTCKQTYGPALALEFYKQTGMGLIIVNSAVGSTAQVAAADNGAGNWDETGALRQTAVDRFNSCENYLDSNNYCYQRGFICWTQGERDGQEIQIGTITKEQYKNALSTMIDFFKTSLGSKLPFILTTTAYYVSSGDNVGSKAVRAAQMETAHEKSGAYVGYTGAVKFFERGLVADGVHYNQIGKNIIGKQLAKVASQLSSGVN